MTKYLFLLALCISPLKSSIQAMEKKKPAPSKAGSLLDLSSDEIVIKSGLKAKKEEAKSAMGETAISRQTLINRISDFKDGKAGSKEQLEQLVKEHPKLLQEYDKLGNSPLYEALLLDNPGMFIFMAETMPSLDRENVLKHRNNKKELLLHNAAMFGMDAIVDYLLKEYPAGINAKDEGNMTPLHYAAENGRTKTIELLLNPPKPGVPVKFCELNGNFEPAILSAAAGGHFDIVNLLLERSHECLNAQDKGLNTIAHYAVMGDKTDEILEKLHKINPDIIKKAKANSKGLTPLALAKELALNAREADEKKFRNDRVEFLEKLK